MSSYHSSFRYLNKDSMKNFKWIIAHFDADSGETDSFLSQEQVFSDTYRGTHRILYGTKWNAVATIKITVIKQDGTDFSVSECREAYRWLTGNPNASWLDLCVGDDIKYSFLVTVQDIKLQKMDARTVGLNIYFESISPWAYSSVQTLSCSFGQTLSVDSGVLYETSETDAFMVDSSGVVSNDNVLSVTEDGTLYIDNSVVLNIDNATDDLYTPVYLNTVFTNKNSDYVSIRNATTGEETIIRNMSKNETITLSAEQFIISDIPGKIFGNTFNFVWPRLRPGENRFVISGSGCGAVDFSYRYPIKIGDCVIDIDELDNVGCVQ